MIGMAALPKGKDHHSRSLLADDPRDLQPVLPGVLHASVGDIERVAPGDLQNLGRSLGFGGSLLGSAAGAHFPLGQVEDAGTVPGLRHL